MFTFIAGVVAGLVLAVAKPLWALAVNAFVVKVYAAIRARLGA